MWLLLWALVGSDAAEQACTSGSIVSWDQVPAPQEIARVVSDLRAPPEVRTELDCSLDAEGRPAHCVVTREEPAGYGFGDAALRLAPEFRMKVASGENSEGRCVRIPMVWRNP